MFEISAKCWKCETTTTMSVQPDAPTPAEWEEMKEDLRDDDWQLDDAGWVCACCLNAERHAADIAATDRGEYLAYAAGIVRSCQHA